MLKKNIREYNKIKNIGDVITGSTPSMKNEEYYGNYLPWITAQDFNGKYIDDSVIKLSELGSTKARIVPKGSILVTCIASIGLNAIAGVDLATNQQINSIVVNDNHYNEFIYYLINHHSNELKRIAGKTAVPIINKREFENYKISCPDKDEQKRIATILSSWDRTIEKIDKLIEAKKKLKQALMQKLLSGLIRFPGFGKSVTKIGELPEGWTEYKIRDIATEISERNRDNFDYPVILCSKHYGFVDSMSFFSKQVFSNKRTEYKIIKKWQFGFPTNHIEEGSIGFLDNYEHALLSPIYIVFEVDNKKVYPPYLYLLLKTESYKHLYAKNTEASVDRRGNLRWAGFSKIAVTVPSVEEQMKISDALNTLEKEIIALKGNKELLEKQKKGLMNLFFN